MRTARRVIVSILLAACCVVLGQEAAPDANAIDQGMTIVGRDDSVVPVPPPPALAPVPLPALDLSWPPTAAPRPILPPSRDLAHPLPVPNPQDVLLDTRVP